MYIYKYSYIVVKLAEESASKCKRFLMWTGCLMTYYDSLSGLFVLMMVFVHYSKCEYYKVHPELCVSIILLCI